jgi:hypothetical protein
MNKPLPELTFRQRLADIVSGGVVSLALWDAERWREQANEAAAETRLAVDTGKLRAGSEIEKWSAKWLHAVEHLAASNAAHADETRRLVEDVHAARARVQATLDEINRIEKPDPTIRRIKKILTGQTPPRK